MEARALHGSPCRRPMTLGQEFTAFERGVRDDIAVLERSTEAVCEINMGGTAIGTGLNAYHGFAKACADHLAHITGIPVHPARDLIEATQSTGAFIELSSALRCFALRLVKLCNDLRLLASGPQAGLAEIELPELQAGSSIMPGKVNPVIPEAVTQVCFDVIGADTAVTLAAQAGRLQLNAFEPLIAHSLLAAQRRLAAACTLPATACVAGIRANAERTFNQGQQLRRPRHRTQPGHRLPAVDRTRPPRRGAAAFDPRCRRRSRSPPARDPRRPSQPPPPGRRVDRRAGTGHAPRRPAGAATARRKVRGRCICGAVPPTPREHFPLRPPAQASPAPHTGRGTGPSGHRQPAGNPSPPIRPRPASRPMHIRSADAAASGGRDGAVPCSRPRTGDRTWLVGP